MVLAAVFEITHRPGHDAGELRVHGQVGEILHYVPNELERKGGERGEGDAGNLGRSGWQIGLTCISASRLSSHTSRTRSVSPSGVIPVRLPCAAGWAAWFPDIERSCRPPLRPSAAFQSQISGWDASESTTTTREPQKLGSPKFSWEKVHASSGGPAVSSTSNPKQVLL